MHAGWFSWLLRVLVAASQTMMQQPWLHQEQRTMGWAGLHHQPELGCSQPGRAVGLQRDNSLTPRAETRTWAPQDARVLNQRFAKDARRCLPPLGYEEQKIARTGVSASDQLYEQAEQWNREEFEDFLRLPGSFQALKRSNICVVKLSNKLIGEPQWIRVRGQDGNWQWVNNGCKVPKGASKADIRLG